MEKSLLVEKINIAYQGSVATCEILESYIGKVRKDWLLADMDSSTILESYTKDCQRYGMWRLKRQVTDTKSESLAGWKACKVAAENILKAQPTNERALELLKASVVYNRLSTMIATVKAELKKPVTSSDTDENGEKVIIAIQPIDCPVSSVWDMEKPIYVFPVNHFLSIEEMTKGFIIATLSKVTAKSTKQELLAVIAELQTAIA